MWIQFFPLYITLVEIEDKIKERGYNIVKYYSKERKEYQTNIQTDFTAFFRYNNRLCIYKSSLDCLQKNDIEAIKRVIIKNNFTYTFENGELSIEIRRKK